MNIQQTIHASSERHLEMAQKNLERLAAHDPDTSWTPAKTGSLIVPPRRLSANVSV
jgi:hypothetical protein